MQMKKVNFGSTGKQVPAIVMGCMRMKELTVKEAAKLVDAAMAEGVDFFDHADIYGGGVCEERFKEAAEEAKISREDMWIQSKCGIVPGVMYDFSKEHIIKSAEDSLQRLGTDYLDSLLLHRPDALMEPEEVAAAFEELHTSGKVRYFGNNLIRFHPGQRFQASSYLLPLRSRSWTHEQRQTGADPP